jgi:hypothetical protein
MYYYTARTKSAEQSLEAQGGQLDFARLLDTPKEAPLASKWMIRSGRILQFQLAGQLPCEEGP